MTGFPKNPKEIECGGPFRIKKKGMDLVYNSISKAVKVHWIDNLGIFHKLFPRGLSPNLGFLWSSFTSYDCFQGLLELVTGSLE